MRIDYSANQISSITAEVDDRLKYYPVVMSRHYLMRRG